MDEHGLESLDALAAEIQRRSEEAMRRAIAALPDGTYRYALETDGLATPVRLEAALTVKGDAIDIDLAGSSPQVGRAINVAMCYTFAYTAFGIKAVLSPDIPNNDGAFRPITVRAPEGTIVNSTFPAAGGARALVGHYLPILVFGALGQVLPERVMAGVGSPLWGMNEAGVRPDGRPYANMYLFNGGMGANAASDGWNCLSWPSNVSCTPVEMIEQKSPFRVHWKRLREDGGGAGRQRGGTGQEIFFESRSATPTAVSFLAERTRFPAPGASGGEAGAMGALLIDGKPVDPKLQHMLRPGGTILMRTPGGGGYGPVTDRDPARREADRRDGYVTDAAPTKAAAE
jgi:N-methylhydantoinase B